MSSRLGNPPERSQERLIDAIPKTPIGRERHGVGADVRWANRNIRSNGANPRYVIQ